MLDLTKVKKYYELKWFDGDVIHLNIPSQQMLKNVMKLEDEDDTAKQLKALETLVKQILKTNIEGKEFTDKDFALLDLKTIQLIMEDYMTFVNEQLGE